MFWCCLLSDCTSASDSTAYSLTKTFPLAFWQLYLPQCFERRFSERITVVVLSSWPQDLWCTVPSALITTATSIRDGTPFRCPTHPIPLSPQILHRCFTSAADPLSLLRLVSADMAEPSCEDIFCREESECFSEWKHWKRTKRTLLAWPEKNLHTYKHQSHVALPVDHSLGAQSRVLFW